MDAHKCGGDIVKRLALLGSRLSWDGWYWSDFIVERESAKKIHCFSVNVVLGNRAFTRIISIELQFYNREKCVKTNVN